MNGGKGENDKDYRILHATSERECDGLALLHPMIGEGLKGKEKGRSRKKITAIRS